MECSGLAVVWAEEKQGIHFKLSRRKETYALLVIE
ncbi:MAG: hypothetical protein CM1200mP12_03000 [Gammaproteobacteria bacterium]|nr:MAG: hypothetical protein CM1200mP12_03000 [Gammaproteobacteria bacterium]